MYIFGLLNVSEITCDNSFGNLPFVMSHVSLRLLITLPVGTLTDLVCLGVVGL